MHLILTFFTHYYREHPSPLEYPSVVEIAEHHGKTPAQILVRHGIQRGLVVIPKSTTPHHISANIDVSTKPPAITWVN